MNGIARLIIGCGIIVASASAMAQGHAGHGAARVNTCPDAGLACAASATPFIADDGKLWLTWATTERVVVAQSGDSGKTFSAPVFVTPEPVKLDAGADSRPQLVIDNEGRIVVTYAIVRGANYTGEVLYSLSTDNGATFTPPRPVTDDTASQRFQALMLDPGGKAFVAWIDKRELVTAKQAGRDYDGAALAFAWLDDGSFTPAHMAVSNSCECCRLAVAFAGPERPAVLWRHIFPGQIRDHAVMTFEDRNTPGGVHRVSEDAWQIEACPHHGPSLAVGATGTYHAAWFTDGQARQGVFYARSTDGGRSFSTPMALGHADLLPSRPQALTAGDVTWLAWKEFDGERTTIIGMTSQDDGKTWSDPRAFGNTTDASDHPLLIAHGGKSYLSWLTKKEGYRLLEIAP